MTQNGVKSLPFGAENGMNNAKGEAACNSPRPLIETQALTQGYRPLFTFRHRALVAQALGAS